MWRHTRTNHNINEKEDRKKNTRTRSTVVLSVANPRTAFLADAYFNIIKCVCFSRFQRPDTRSCKHKRHYAPFFTTRAAAGKERGRRTRKISFAPIPVGVLSYTLDNIWFPPFSMYIRAAHVSQKNIHSSTHTRACTSIYCFNMHLCGKTVFHDAPRDW